MLHIEGATPCLYLASTLSASKWLKAARNLGLLEIFWAILPRLYEEKNMQNNCVHLVYFFMKVHLFYLYVLLIKANRQKYWEWFRIFSTRVLLALKLFLNVNLKRSQNELSIPLLLGNVIFNMFVHDYWEIFVVLFYLGKTQAKNYTPLLNWVLMRFPMPYVICEQRWNL